MSYEIAPGPETFKKPLEKHSMKNKFVPVPEFAKYPINIKDDEFNFSIDLSLIPMVEAEPFCGKENDDVVAHLTKLFEICALFSDKNLIRGYYVVKLFPFSLKDDANSWYDNLPYGCIESPQGLTRVFCEKYFPAHMQHAALQKIFNFKQLEDEKLPKAWARFCATLKGRPDHGIPNHELIDIL